MRITLFLSFYLLIPIITVRVFALFYFDTYGCRGALLTVSRAKSFFAHARNEKIFSVFLFFFNVMHRVKGGHSASHPEALLSLRPTPLPSSKDPDSGCPYS